MKSLLNRHPVLLIMAFSLSIKLGLFSFDQVINPDGVLYIAAAQQIAAGNLGEAIKLYPMPAYPLLLVFVHFLIPDWVAAARIIGIAALILATVPLYGISRILFNRQAAFWATLCFAVTPEANEQALMVIRDPIFLLMALTAVLLFIQSIHAQSLFKVALALLFTGISFLFRVEGIVFWGAPIMFLAFTSFLGKDAPLRRFSRKAIGIWVGLPVGVILATGIVLGSSLLGQNRLGELMSEARQIIQLKAFDNYREIYQFFKTIETEAPFSGFSKSLPAIVRHWMPLIYLIGLLEYFVKQMFPLFLLPLLVAAGGYFSNQTKTYRLEKRFVLVIWFVYMLFILYSFMVRDFIQGRFLFTPAVLLYPWVGQGITLILKWIKGIRFSRPLQIALVLVVLGAPCAKSAKMVMHSDRGALEVGRFISQDRRLEDAKMMFSDSRFWLYGNESGSYRNIIEPVWTISRYLEQGNSAAIEKMALQRNADAIVIAVNTSKTDSLPRFEHYEVYERFPSRKGVTIIYTLKYARQNKHQDDR